MSGQQFQQQNVVQDEMFPEGPGSWADIEEVSKTILNSCQVFRDRHFPLVSRRYPAVWSIWQTMKEPFILISSTVRLRILEYV